MKQRLFVCFVLAFMLAACVPLPPSVALPDPKTDPLAALRYSVSSERLQTASFTLTAAQSFGPATAIPPVVIARPLDTPPVAPVYSPDDPLGFLTFTTVSWGAVRFSDPAALDADQQRQIKTPVGTRVVFPTEVVVVDNDSWGRLGTSPWQKTGPVESEEEMGHPWFERLVFPELRTMIAAAREATNAEWIEDITLEGETVHHLRFSPGLDVLGPCFLSGSIPLVMMGPVDCEKGNAEVNGEVWLSTESLALRQLLLRVNQERSDSDERLFLDRTLQLDDINKQVQIMPPS